MSLLDKSKNKGIYLALGSATGTIAAPFVSKMIEEFMASRRRAAESDPAGVIESEMLDDDVEEGIEMADEVFFDVVDPKREIYERIDRWLKANGGCRVKFTISAQKGDYIYFDWEEIVERGDADIFEEDPEKLRGKSKFEKFADDLEERGKKDAQYSKYLEGFRARCSKNDILVLHWRDQVNRSEVGRGRGKQIVGGLVNVWVDESILEVKKISSGKILEA